MAFDGDDVTASLTNHQQKLITSIPTLQTRHDRFSNKITSTRQKTKRMILWAVNIPNHESIIDRVPSFKTITHIGQQTETLSVPQGEGKSKLNNSTIESLADKQLSFYKEGTNQQHHEIRCCISIF